MSDKVIDEKYKDGNVYITDHALRITHYRLRIVDTMSEIANQSLQKIAKGTGIIFTGNIIGMLLAFVGRVIIYNNHNELQSVPYLI